MGLTATDNVFLVLVFKYLQKSIDLLYHSTPLLRHLLFLQVGLSSFFLFVLIHQDSSALIKFYFLFVDAFLKILVRYEAVH